MDFAMLLASFLLWSEGFIATFGYLGVFVVSLVSAASIFIPVPGFIFILAAATFLNPFLVAIVAGAGMAIGEMTGYAIGGGSSYILKKGDYKWLKMGEKWFKKDRGFFIILIFAATPLPDDITGILGGMFKYDWRRFLLAAFIGKTLLNLALALAAFYGFNALVVPNL